MIESCDTKTGKNTWYSGQTPRLPDGTSVSSGTWDRQNCVSPCICNSAGTCFVPLDPFDPTSPSPQNPVFTFYPHCDTPTTCFIAVIFETQGELNSMPFGVGAHNYIDQVDQNGAHKDVRGAEYLRAKRVGCSGCPVVIL